MLANRNVPIGTVHVDVGGLLEVSARAACRDVALYIEDELAVFECERLIVVDALCKRDEGAYVTDGVRVLPGTVRSHALSHQTVRPHQCG